MFAFPISDVDRTRQWLAASGNSSLLCLPPATIKYRKVCARHFRAEDRGGKNLLRRAIPTLFLPVPIDASSWPPHTGDQHTKATASIDRPEEFQRHHSP